MRTYCYVLLLLFTQSFQTAYAVDQGALLASYGKLQERIQRVRERFSPYTVDTPEEYLWDVSDFPLEGERAVTKVRQQLTLIDDTTAQLSFTATVSDREESHQVSAEKLLYWTQYSPLGPHRIQRKGLEIYLDEAPVGYRLVFSDEKEAERVARVLRGLISAAHAKIRVGRALAGEGGGDIPSALLERVVDEKLHGQVVAGKYELLSLSPGTILAREGYDRLVHHTRPENLKKIVESGVLRPGGSGGATRYGDPIGNHRGVFLSAVHSSSSDQELLRFVDNQLPLLLFSGAPLLDQHRFHISAGYPYGRFLKLRCEEHHIIPSASSLDPTALRRFARNQVIRGGNEVVVKGEVPVGAETTLLVAEGEREKWVAQLGEEWRARIREVALLHKELIPALPHEGAFAPYSANSGAVILAHLHGRPLQPRQLLERLAREYPYIHERFAEEGNQLVAAVAAADDGATSNRVRFAAALQALGLEAEPLLPQFGF